VNDQEGGNWIGTSYLRSLFKHWVRKDRLLRVDAINAERNGAGIPLAYARHNATKEQMAALATLAQSYRLVNRPAVRFPTDLTFASAASRVPYPTCWRASATTTSRWPRVLGHVHQAGYDWDWIASARANPVDFFALGQEAIRKQYADTTNEHVIEDLIDVNYAIDAAPLLKFSTETDKRYAVADLAALVKGGALTPDPGLEAYLRAEGDLPELVDDEEPEDAAGEGDEPTPIHPAARKRVKAMATVRCLGWSSTLPLAEDAGLTVLAIALATAQSRRRRARRTPDRAAAADVTYPCADQDRASRRSAGD